MTLACEPLPARTPPVALLFDWGYGAGLLSLRSEIEAAAEAFADRITPASPLAPLPEPFTALTPWGPVDSPPVPADTLRVWVGPATGADHLGEGGPVGWSAVGPAPARGPGFSLALDPAADWLRFSLPTVVRHEVLHGVGVDEHSPNPAALMAPHLAPGVTKDATAADAELAARHGWHLDLPSSPPAPSLPATGFVRVLDPYGLPGYQILPAATARSWAAHGTLGRWDVAAPPA